jgi:hypothetical protein
VPGGFAFARNMGNVPATGGAVFDKFDKVRRGTHRSREAGGDRVKVDKSKSPNGDNRQGDFDELECTSDEPPKQRKPSALGKVFGKKQSWSRRRSASGRRNSEAGGMAEATETSPAAKHPVVVPDSSLDDIEALPEEKPSVSPAIPWAPASESDVHASIKDIGGVARLRELLYCFYTEYNFEKVM